MKLIKNSIIKEESLYDGWELFCRHRGVSKDKRLRGFYSGRLDRFDGPDFQGAEIELDKQIYRGDIELHVRSGDWYLHGHHLDARYDHVILHLVWHLNGSSDSTVRNSKGLLIPNFSMRQLQIPKPDYRLTIKNCTLVDSNNAKFNESLKKIALHRLLTKARNMNLLNENYSFDQTLYLSILRILGIPQNQFNFERLAQILPWEDVIKMKFKYHFSIEHWLTVFLMQSGLLNRKSSFTVLQKYAYELQPFLNKNGMPGEIWKFAGQRPNHNPFKRILGLAHFIHQFPSASLYETFRDILSRRLDFNTLYQALTKILDPKASPFLLNLVNISSKLWGYSLITEVIGNILIPFFYNQALARSSLGYLLYLEDYMFSLPETVPYSRLKQYYDWPELKHNRQAKFYLNQALLTLKDNYCDHQACCHCPVGRISEIN